MTRPIIGIIWNFQNNGFYTKLLVKALVKYDAIPLKISSEPPNMIPERLENELFKSLTAIHEKEYSPNRLSIADEIIKNAQQGSEIGEIASGMKDLYYHLDGLIFPGGDNIEECFYKKEPEIMPSFDNNGIGRSLIEFSLAREAYLNSTKPTIGICRGAQLLNVYFGGTLKNVDGHFNKIQNLTFKESLETSDQKFMLNFTKNSEFAALSVHFQACDAIGSELKVGIEKGSVPKLIFNRSRGFLLTQFHPEAALFFSSHSYQNELTHQMASAKFLLHSAEDPSEKERWLQRIANLQRRALKVFSLLKTSENFFIYFVAQARRTLPQSS